MGSPQYAINESFFDTHTPESCYWAGFIGADGAVVGKEGNQALSFSLSPIDAEYLALFTKAAGAGHPIRLLDRAKYNMADCIYLSIKNRRWIAALLKNFNLTPRKTFTLKPPPLTGDLAMHYIRGFFDGDGHFDPKQRTVEIAGGSKPLLEWIAATWKVQTGLYEINGRKSQLWRIKAGSPTIVELFQSLYKDAPVGLRLERKYQAFLTAVEYQKGAYKGGRKKVSDEELRRWADEGKSFHQIEELVGVGRTSVRNRLRRMGYVRGLGYRSPDMRSGQSNANGRAPKVPLEVLVAKLDGTRSLSQIAREVGMDVTSVRARFIRQKIDYKSKLSLKSRNYLKP